MILGAVNRQLIMADKQSMALAMTAICEALAKQTQDARTRSRYLLRASAWSLIAERHEVLSIADQSYSEKPTRKSKSLLSG